MHSRHPLTFLFRDVSACRVLSLRSLHRVGVAQRRHLEPLPSLFTFSLKRNSPSSTFDYPLAGEVWARPDRKGQCVTLPLGKNELGPGILEKSAGMGFSGIIVTQSDGVAGCSSCPMGASSFTPMTRRPELAQPANTVPKEGTNANAALRSVSTLDLTPTSASLKAQCDERGEDGAQGGQALGRPRGGGSPVPASSFLSWL